MLAAFGLAILSFVDQAMHPGTHRVVVEVDHAGAAIYGDVLNHAERLAKAFAPEPVQIEVVCHGEGIAMLRPSQKFTKRMAADAKAGVVFAACHNTMAARHLAPKDLYPFAKVVPAGIVEVVRKEEAGWSYIKAG